MSVYDHRCSDCQVCPSCGGTAWCEGDRILVVPCEHHGYCGDCNLERCRDCAHIAELDEWAENCGAPHDVTEGHPLDVAAWITEVDARAAERGFNPATNSYDGKNTA